MWNIPFPRRASTFTELMVAVAILAILFTLVMLLQRLEWRDAEPRRTSG